jgi:hypothetical protein
MPMPHGKLLRAWALEKQTIIDELKEQYK